MKNYRKHIDDFFREKLGNYTETPPPEVWDDLNTRLDSLQPPTGFQPRMLLHFAMASLLLVLGVSIVKKTSFYAANQNVAVNEKPAIAANNTTASGNARKEAEASQPGIVAATGQEGNTTGNNGMQAGSNGLGGTVSNTKVNNAAANNAATKKQTGGHATARGNNHLPKAIYAASNSRNSSVPKNTVSGQTPMANTGDVVGGEEGKGANANTLIIPTSLSQNKPVAVKKSDAVAAKAKAETKTPNPAFNRFEMGVKGGYEMGFNNGAAAKYVVSPYLQYNLTRKVSVMVQPAVKYATVNSVNIGSPQTYYVANGAGQISKQPVKDSVITNSSGTSTSYLHYTTYSYSQALASMVKTYSYGGTYAEFELPVLLKYKMLKNLSAYGGVNINYSQLIGINTSTRLVNPNAMTVTKNATDTATTSSAKTYAAPLPFSSVINTTGYTDVKQPQYASPQSGQLRCGYVIGFSYECGKRWLFDGMVEQTPMKPDVQGGYNLNTPLSSTYFRFTVGYKIIH